MKKLINFFRNLFGQKCPKCKCNPCKCEPEVPVQCKVEQDLVCEGAGIKCTEPVTEEVPVVTTTPKKKRAPRKKKQPAEKK